MSEPRTPWTLRVGLLGLAFVLVSLIAIMTYMQVEVAELLYSRDPLTGDVIEQLRVEQRDVQLAVTHSYGPMLFWTPKLFWAAVINLALIFVGVRRLERGGELRLGLVFVSLATPLLLGLAAITYLDNVLHRRWLIELHELISDVELRWIPTCVGDLEPCSLLLGLDSVATIVAPLISLLAMLCFVPAARVAWCAGACGAQLNRGWSRAAILCFVLGALALAATQAHRGDRARVLEDCTQTRPSWRDLPSSWIDLTPDELQGVEFNCGAELSRLDNMTLSYWPERSGPVARYQLTEAGELSELATHDERGTCVDEADAIAALGRELERAREHQQQSSPGRDAFMAIELYADARTPTSTLAAKLPPIFDAGVDVVTLLATSTISGELATVGAWNRHVSCPLGFLILDPSGAPLDDWHTVAELAREASERGPEGLRISPSR